MIYTRKDNINLLFLMLLGVIIICETYRFIIKNKISWFAYISLLSILIIPLCFALIGNYPGMMDFREHYSKWKSAYYEASEYVSENSKMRFYAFMEYGKYSERIFEDYPRYYFNKNNINVQYIQKNKNYSIPKNSIIVVSMEERHWITRPEEIVKLVNNPDITSLIKAVDSTVIRRSYLNNKKLRSMLTAQQCISFSQLIEPENKIFIGFLFYKTVRDVNVRIDGNNKLFVS